MLSGPVLGRLLGLLVRLSGAARIREVGMFTGYATQWMASTLAEGGHIDSCEIDADAIFLAQKHFRKSGVDALIRIHQGDAMETVQSLTGPYDFAFLDADKLRYTAYYESMLEKLRPQGLIVVDNTLWYGKVLNPRDERSRAVASFNRHVAADPRVECVLLPVGDGIQVIRKL
jgi:caffeoyl-CoA O-methyltransferase